MVETSSASSRGCSRASEVWPIQLVAAAGGREDRAQQEDATGHRRSAVQDVHQPPLGKPHGPDLGKPCSHGPVSWPSSSEAESHLAVTHALATASLRWHCSGTALEVRRFAMTKFRSALLVLLAAFAVACNRWTPRRPRPRPTPPTRAGRQPAAPAPLPATTASVAPTASPSTPHGRRDARVPEAHRGLHEDSQRGRGQGAEPQAHRRSGGDLRAREGARRDDHDAARRRASRATIFAPEYQPYFIKIVQDDFAKRSRRRSQGARPRAAEEREGRRSTRSTRPRCR